MPDGDVLGCKLLREVSAVATAGSTLTHVQRGIVDLYRRYCDEWARFPVQSPARRSEHAA